MLIFIVYVRPAGNNVSHMIPGSGSRMIGRIPGQTRSYGTRFDIMNFQACEGSAKRRANQILLPPDRSPGPAFRSPPVTNPNPHRQYSPIHKIIFPKCRLLCNLYIFDNSPYNEINPTSVLCAGRDIFPFSDPPPFRSTKVCPASPGKKVPRLIMGDHR
jgi:hypothetical protein